MYQRLASLNLFFQALIVVTGATVRLTGSGLGCSHWPQCTETRTLPAMDFHALIEFGNRMISLPLTVIAVAAFAATWRMGTRRSDLRWGSGLVLIGVITQIVVGGLSVIYELPPLLVSAHFLISVAILAAATWTWHASRSTTPLQLGARTRTAVLAIVMLVSAAAVIVAGVLTTAGGPFSGAEARGIVERFGNWQLAITVHARGAYVFAALVIALTLWARRTRAGMRDLALLTGIIVIQITIGEIQYRTDLPRGLVLAHIANATIMWIVTCLIAWRACAPIDSGSNDRLQAGEMQHVGDSDVASQFDTVQA
jgi:cytochrome c oxidase assembly protein subunit 15